MDYIYQNKIQQNKKSMNHVYDSLDALYVNK